MKIEYLCFILYFQISFKKCAIDVNLPEYIYIADHLTDEECRKLYAALHYISYELPEDFPQAEKQIPEDVPCIKLLMQWNGGDEKYEGKRKTHYDIEHRLRQMGKSDIADWLGKTVFHNIGKELNRTHADPVFIDDKRKHKGLKIFKDKSSKHFGEGWTTIDTILCVLLMGLLVVTLSAFIRMLSVSWSKSSSSKDKDEEEMIDLLSAGSVDSDQETYESEDKITQHNVDVAKSTSMCQIR